jgi:hypothetical protein
MPGSPFLSNSAEDLTSGTAECEAVASKSPPTPDATVNLSNSCADVMLVQESAAVTEPVTVVAAVPISGHSPSIPCGYPHDVCAPYGRLCPMASAAPINVIGHNPVTHAVEVRPQLTPSCDVRVAGDPSPMHDGRTWEQRRALTNGDSLVLEPTLTGRGACDSAVFLSGHHAVEVRPQVSPGEVCCSVPSGQSDPAVTLDYAPGESTCSVLTAPSMSANGPERCAVQDRPLTLSESNNLIAEILVGADRLQPRALPPDFHARLLEAIESDVAWADEAPLFLRRDV